MIGCWIFYSRDYPHLYQSEGIITDNAPSANEAAAMHENGPHTLDPVELSCTIIELLICTAFYGLFFFHPSCAEMGRNDRSRKADRMNHKMRSETQFNSIADEMRRKKN